MLCFLPTNVNAATLRLLEYLSAQAPVFEAESVMIFAVTRGDGDSGMSDAARSWLKGKTLFDRAGRVFRAYDVPDPSPPRDEAAAGVLTYLVDRRMRVDRRVDTPSALVHVGEILSWVRYRERTDAVDVEQPDFGGFAPVLMIPGVFEPDFCRLVLSWFAAAPKYDSGFMHQSGENTVGMIDYARKRRTDVMLKDYEQRLAIQNRLARRVFPEMGRAFQYQVTRIERYVVACYDSSQGDHFHKHRDNATRATIHRKFALTVNLNDGYEGGALTFPEHGDTEYRPPLGAGVVFSCGLMHQANPVIRGRRFAFLSFFHDEQGETDRIATQVK